MPQAKVKFFDTGHFALETHFEQIGSEVRHFLDQIAAANLETSE
jgi:hypothetical protein